MRAAEASVQRKGGTDDMAETIYAKREYKATVFHMLFQEKKASLGLYNAVNGTHYTNPDDLEIVTLENAIYMAMENDVSFILDFQLSMYEHQSTFNPNMPLRDLFYVSRQYEKLIDKADIYSSRLLKLPTPKFVVFYNGIDPQPERRVLRLSEAFQSPTETPELELLVTMLNINVGHNRELMEQCEELRGYAVLVGKIRAYLKELTLPEAVEQSVQECIEEDILREFLLRNRKEVVQMSIFEYDEEAHMKLVRREGWEDGKAAGKIEGKAEGKAEGKLEGARDKLKEQVERKLQKGKTIEEIADALEESPETIQALMHELKEA